MGANLDIYIDTATGELISGGSIIGGALPTLTRNDSYTLRLRLMEKNPAGAYDDIDSSGASLKVGIGDIEQPPSSGTFTLSANGTTSTAIPYNATAVCVFNAISNNVSTVALYGSDSFGSYLLTASQPNTAMSFGGDAGLLFPASSVLVNTRRNPATGIFAQQVIKLVKNPAVFSDIFTNSPTSGEISLTLVQNGGLTANETYELKFGPLVRGGLYSINYGGNSTTGIPPYQSAVSVQAQLQVVTGIGTGNISVQENGDGGYIIQFVGARAQQNITTPLILDASGVNFIPLKQTTLTMNTSELEDLFEEAGEDTISPTLEVELTQNGYPKTIFQGSVNIRKDLINTGAAVPAPQSSYLTSSEIAAIYIPNSTANVDATNRQLVDSSGNEFIDWENKKIGYGTTQIDLSGNPITFPDNLFFSFGTTTGTEIGTTTAQKLGFFGQSPVGQPTGTNVLSALTNLGFIAASVTYGTSVVSNSSVNVNATSQSLHTGGFRSVDWGARTLLNTSGVTIATWRANALSVSENLVLVDDSAFTSVSVGQTYGSKIGTATAQKLGFWNSTPVTQPNQSNVVTALRGCGLLAGGPSVSTFGVLPLSTKTLTTTASINFGTISNNSSNSVSIVVTGASINDIVLIGLPSAVSNGLSFLGHVTAIDGVEIDAVNATNGSISQSTQTFRITVIGY